MRKTLRLKDLDCANCAAKMERGIKKLRQVTHVEVNFMTQKMVLETPDECFDEVLEEARKIIRKLEPQVEVVF